MGSCIGSDNTSNKHNNSSKQGQKTVTETFTDGKKKVGELHKENYQGLGENPE
jgi:hypothetical protein